MNIENEIAKSMFSSTPEKTFIDKIMVKDDVNAIKELIKKKNLTREQLLEILYLVSGNEAKMVNYSDWERYVILKFFVWIREFVKIAELMFDYRDYLEDTNKSHIHLNERTQKILDNNTMLIEHNAKFLIDLYLNISRTSLSVGATGFLELLKNKFEITYPQASAETGGQQQQGLLAVKKV
jgi:hypothetical protein